jgi:hypothetical protein
MPVLDWLICSIRPTPPAGYGHRQRGMGTASAYRSQKNEALLKQRMLKSHIHRKKPKGRPMPARTAKRPSDIGINGYNRLRIGGAAC